MSIGIGLNCWYCDHGPCTKDCEVEKRKTRAEIRNSKIDIIISKKIIKKSVKKINK